MCVIRVASRMRALVPSQCNMKTIYLIDLDPHRIQNMTLACRRRACHKCDRTIRHTLYGWPRVAVPSPTFPYNIYYLSMGPRHPTVILRACIRRCIGFGTRNSTHVSASIDAPTNLWTTCPQVQWTVRSILQTVRCQIVAKTNHFVVSTNRSRRVYLFHSPFWKSKQKRRAES